MNEQEKWKSSLLEGEKLKWSGRPEDVQLMDTSSNGMTIALWAISITWILLSLIFYVPYAISIGNTGGNLVLVLVVINIIPLMMLYMPVSDCRILQKNTEYAITDQRVLCRSRDKVITLVITPDMVVSVRKRSGGKGHVLLGEAADKGDSKLRALAGKHMEKDGQTTGMVLYHITDPEKVASLISAGKHA